MKKKSYEIIEHTADIGIRVRGKDFKELLERAALAMFDIIAKKKKVPTSTEQANIELKAQNRDELFVNWLNELLSLSATKEIIFTDFKFSKLTENELEVIAQGESNNNYRVNVEIKAATYHQLKIEETKQGWLAEVIFDV
ncbi:MAG: archease [Candidatus Omnitrophota bacterium]